MTTELSGQAALWFSFGFVFGVIRAKLNNYSQS
jgi:hypothetical protein